MIDLKKYRKLKSGHSSGEVRQLGDVLENGQPIEGHTIGQQQVFPKYPAYRLRKKPYVSSKRHKPICVKKNGKNYTQSSKHACEKGKSYMLPSKEFIQPVRVWICQPYWCNAIGTNYIFSDRCKATQMKFLAGKGSRRMFQAIIIPIKPQKITPIRRKK